MMKTKFALIGVLSLGLAACGKKEEENAAANPETSGRLASLAAERSRPKPAAPADAAGEARSLADAAAAAAEVAGGQAEPLAETIQPAPAAPASPAAPALSQEERDRLRAQAREERTARVRQEMAARWAERDTDGDGRLSQAELPERMRARFADLDTNGDGFIDASEQQAMIQRFSERMGEARGRGNQRDRRRGEGRGGFERRRGNR